MPTVKTVRTNRNGAFFIKFGQNERHDFYGQDITAIEAFRRYGNLPDNNILANKVINILGKHLLNLEKQQEELELNTRMSPNRKAKIALCSRLERESTAFHIKLLTQLTFLETLENHKGKPLDEKDPIIQSITDLYAEYDKRLEDLIKELEAIPKRTGNNRRELTSAELIHISRLKTLRDQVENNKQQMIADLRQGKEPLIVYRKVMDNFAKEQHLISVYQHTAAKPLTYANQSLTEAYQDASYALENHVFSKQIPTKNQLWQFDDPLTGDIVLDSRQVPSMRKHDAIYTACFIHKKNQKVPLKSAQHNFDRLIKFISDRSEANKKTKEPTLARRQKNDETRRNQDREGGKTPRESANALMGTLALKNSSDNARASDASFLRNKDGTPRLKVPSESPVYLYHAADVLSAVGFACTDFAKFFEREMSAKSPVKTGLFFVATGLTFGSAGLAAAGVGSAKVASTLICKGLTAGGHLGSTAAVQQQIGSISNVWLHETGSQANLFRTFLVEFIALPLINYTAMDTLLNRFEHKDTIMLISQRFAEQHTEFFSTEEQRKEFAIKMVLFGAIMGVAIVAGIGAEYGAHYAALKNICLAFSNLDDANS
ncbi:MAG: hypothetical protein ACHP65_09885, partial [Legionellales bacterium]